MYAAIYIIDTLIILDKKLFLGLVASNYDSKRYNGAELLKVLKTLGTIVVYM